MARELNDWLAQGIDAMLDGSYTPPGCIMTTSRNHTLMTHGTFQPLHKRN